MVWDHEVAAGTHWKACVLSVRAHYLLMAEAYNAPEYAGSTACSDAADEAMGAAIEGTQAALEASAALGGCEDAERASAAMGKAAECFDAHDYEGAATFCMEASGAHSFAHSRLSEGA